MFNIQNAISSVLSEFNKKYTVAPCYYGSVSHIYNPNKGDFKKRTLTDENI